MDSLQALSFLESINPTTKREILKKMCIMTKHTSTTFALGRWINDDKYYYSSTSEDERNNHIISDLLEFMSIELDVDKDYRYIQMYNDKAFPACTCTISSEKPEYKDIFAREKWSADQVISHFTGNVNRLFPTDCCGKYHAGEMGIYENIEHGKWMHEIDDCKENT